MFFMLKITYFIFIGILYCFIFIFFALKSNYALNFVMSIESTIKYDVL